MAMKSITRERAFANLGRRIERSFSVDEAGCWIWQRGFGAGGYGAATLHGKQILAHRAAWLIYRGPIPEDMNVCHKCDVPACINPNHLFLGSQRDNMQDAARKGRVQPPKGAEHWSFGRGDLQAGEKSSRARLKEGDVRSIRTSTEPLADIAARYGVSESHISNIRARLRWRHLP